MDESESVPVPNRPTVSFDRAKLRRLKSALAESDAKAARLGVPATESFTFDGLRYAPGYARYLIEYMEKQLQLRGELN